jgi:pimeloyl-ACP methyl ester carboxylesterase
VQPKTLIIWGTGDTFVQQESATYSQDFCRDVRVRFIEGASHWVQQDEPDMANRFVDEFLSESD